MAITMLQDDFECQTKNYTQYCCDKCYQAFQKMDFSQDPNVCQKHRNLINFAPKQKARANSLCVLIKNTKYCKNDADQMKNDADPIKISAIKEELRLKLTLTASKLLSSEHFNFCHLSGWSNISGANLTKRRYTNLSLGRRTRFQNSNTIG